MRSLHGQGTLTLAPADHAEFERPRNRQRQLTLLPRLHQEMRVPNEGFLETSFLDSAFPSPTELVGFFVCLFFFLLLPSCDILLRISPLKPCLPPRSDCAKVAPAPCPFPCVPGARSADFSHKIKLSQPLPPISPASLPQEERTGFSLLCISRIIHQLGFTLTTWGGGAWEMMRKCPWGVCMASHQRHSAFLLRGGDLVQCLSGSGKWQAAVVSEPSSFLAFIPAKHLCSRLSAPPRFAEGWLSWKPHCGQTPGCHLSAGPTPCSGCPGPHAVVPDMGCDNCSSCISLHLADPGSRQQTSPGSCADVRC